MTIAKAKPDALVGIEGAEGLTRFVAELGKAVSFETLPALVVRRTKYAVLDTLGCILIGAQSEAARIVRDVTIVSRRDGAATVLGAAPAHDGPIEAAFANGIAAHVLELDDGGGGIGHPSCALMPGALAIAELRDASGTAFIAALNAGFETAARVVGLVGGEHYDAGFHSTATLSCFSTAAACAHLLGLDIEQWRMALGIAGSEAAGLRINFGTMTKPFHAGRAASAGVLAARLAQEGFTAAPDVLEGRSGFAWTQAPVPHPDLAWRPFGSPFVMENSSFKFHAACFGTHSALDATKQLALEHHLNADAVEHIAVRAAPHRLEICNIVNPKDALEAKFSLRFTVAMALLDYDTTEAGFMDDAIVDDPVIRSVMEHVSVTSDPLLDRRGPTEVEITLRDGRHYSLSHNSIKPWSDVEAEGVAVEEKFRRLTSGVLENEVATEVIERIENLEDEPSMRAIVGLLGE